MNQHEKVIEKYAINMVAGKVLCEARLHASYQIWIGPEPALAYVVHTICSPCTSNSSLISAGIYLKSSLDVSEESEIYRVYEVPKQRGLRGPILNISPG
jgi:hypothetical protein